MPKEKTGPQINCGGVIWKYRKAAGLSRQELSRKLNISQNQLGNWETNKSEPRASTILQICRTLNIPLYEIYGIPESINDLTGEEGDTLNVLRKSTPQIRKTVRDLLYAVNGISLKKGNTGVETASSSLVTDEGKQIKRGRGRPRTKHLPGEDSKQASEKRGRGRPRKNAPRDRFKDAKK